MSALAPLLNRFRRAADTLESLIDPSKIQAVATEYTDAMHDVIEWARKHQPCVACNSRPAHPLSASSRCDQCLTGAKT